MQGIIDMILKWRTQITVVVNAIIILVAVIFIGKAVMKAISAISDGNYGEGGKHILGGLVIALLAALGVYGVWRAMRAVAGDAGNVGLDLDNDVLNGAVRNVKLLLNQ